MSDRSDDSHKYNFAVSPDNKELLECFNERILNSVNRSKSNQGTSMMHGSPPQNTNSKGDGSPINDVSNNSLFDKNTKTPQNNFFADTAEKINNLKKKSRPTKSKSKSKQKGKPDHWSKLYNWKRDVLDDKHDNQRRLHQEDVFDQHKQFIFTNPKSKKIMHKKNQSVSKNKLETWNTMSNWKKHVLDDKLDNQKKLQEEEEIDRNEKYVFTNIKSEKILRNKDVPRCQNVEDTLKLAAMRKNFHLSQIKKEVTPSFQPNINKNTEKLANRHRKKHPYYNPNPTSSATKYYKQQFLPDCECSKCMSNDNLYEKSIRFFKDKQRSENQDILVKNRNALNLQLKSNLLKSCQKEQSYQFCSEQSTDRPQNNDYPIYNVYRATTMKILQE